MIKNGMRPAMISEKLLITRTDSIKPEKNMRLTFSSNGIEWGSLRIWYPSVLLGFFMLRIEGLQKDGEGASHG
jgi:hypothetical protein